MSRKRPQSCHHARRFPRVSGDEPAFKELGGDIKEFSPRERG